jgi:DNA polymerase-1
MAKPKIKERLYLLDGMALAYRAYFSFISRPLINSKGENTSAIFGFVNVLMKILNEDKPEHIAVCFDTRQPTFRHILYEEYKATREKMPEDLSSQLDMLKETILAFNVPLIEKPTYEADDIMGTLARQAEKKGLLTYLVTGDKDFMQLISPLIKMYKPGKAGDEWELLDETAVEKKFGCEPKNVIDVLGLTGDTSDNVPGVPGVGEKTAIPLVQKYGSIENIYKHVKEIPQNGLRQKLIDNQEKAMLSKKLVTIDTDVPLPVDVTHLEAKAPDFTKLLRLFEKFEFKTLARKIAQAAEMAGVTSPEPGTEEVAETETAGGSETPLTDITTDRHAYHLITHEDDLKKLVEKLKTSPHLVFDTETTSQDPMQAELVGISLAVKSGEAWYIAIEATQSSGLFDAHNARGIPYPVALKILAPIFSNAKIKKIGQNLKYDLLVLRNHGAEIEGELFDTMLASFALRPDGSHGMDALAREQFNYKMVSYDDLTGTGKNRKPLREIEIEKVSDYSCEDADITMQLYDRFTKLLKKEEMRGLCDEIEFPLIDVLASMEFTGVKIDEKFLKKYSGELTSVLNQRVKEIYEHAGREFNINSTQQLGKILFEEIKLKTGKKTKTGYSTDINVLESLRSEHPIIECLLEYRQLQKLKSTYADALHSLINPKTGRLHTTYNQAGALTGRLSSNNPNLQNIPIKTELGRKIRHAFIPGEKGMVILAADYSQIELRIMAHLSGDEGMIEAFVNGEDIHATTAAKVFGVDLAGVTREMRRRAKEINFGLMYGMGPFGLASRLGISQAESKDIITKYFARFPKVKQHISDTLAETKRTGYAVTLRGRKRFFPDLKSGNAAVRANAERQAINMPIQGTAADMIKIAMIDTHAALQKSKLKGNMLLQVHDELVFEVQKTDAKKLETLVKDKMSNALPLKVPIEVSTGIGDNWFEAH